MSWQMTVKKKKHLTSKRSWCTLKEDYLFIDLFIFICNYETTRFFGKQKLHF